jgi:hypothetical protein
MPIYCGKSNFSNHLLYVRKTLQMKKNCFVLLLLIAFCAVNSNLFGQDRDYGDAPSSYGQASHTTGDYYLGTAVDYESANNNSTNADADDNDATNDEDGVLEFPFLSFQDTGKIYKIDVAYTRTTDFHRVIGWIDFDRNGTFDSNESAEVYAFSGTTGTVTLEFTVPNDLEAGATYARFRISKIAPNDQLEATDAATDYDDGGEVEDYKIGICTPGFAAIGVTESSRGIDDDAFICENDSIQMTAMGGVSYLWDSIAGNQSTASITLNPSAYTIYHVDVTDSIGCTETARQIVEVQPCMDTDGDLVFDFEDMDDDNDGILDLWEYGNCTTGIELIQVVETFGTGDRSSSPYTDYCYEIGVGDGSCPVHGRQTGNGEYAIVQESRDAAFYPNWTDFTDHTGDSLGRMMIVNADVNPGEMYRRTVFIASNTDVTVDLWIRNIIEIGDSIILPNITFKLEDLQGNVLQSQSFGDVPEDEQWHNYELSLSPGNRERIQVVLVNSAPGGDGNDLAIDDITIKQTLCDLDNDSIPDYLDLDTDGDGCADAIEAGHFQYLNPNLTISGPYGVNGLAASIEDYDSIGTAVNYAIDTMGSVSNYKNASTTMACMVPPIAVNDSAFTTVNNDIASNLLSNDTTPKYKILRGDSISILLAPTIGMAVNNGDSTITYTPNSDTTGIDSLQYRVCDTLGFCDTAMLFIVIESVNRPPVAVDDQVSTPEDTPVYIDVQANDTDPDCEPTTTFRRVRIKTNPIKGVKKKTTTSPHNEDKTLKRKSQKDR